MFIKTWDINRLKVAQTGRLKTVQHMHFVVNLDNIFEYFLYSWIIYLRNNFRLLVLCIWSAKHCLLQLLRIVLKLYWNSRIVIGLPIKKTFRSWRGCLLFTSTAFRWASIWIFTKAIKTLAIHYWTTKTKSISIFVISTMYKRVYFFWQLRFCTNNGL